MRFLELRIPPLLLAIVAAVAIGWPDADALALTPTLVLAVLAGTTGGALAITGVLAFRRAHTTLHPQRLQDSAKLVRGGVYRLTRNPMYLGFALMLAAWALIVGQPHGVLVVAVFVAWLTRFQIIPEERALEARFGDSFRTWRKRVRRWI